MMTIQDMLLFVVGIIACFAGYSMFKEMLPVWGFFLGGWITFTLMPGLLPEYGGQMAYRIAAFVVGGFISSLLASPLYLLAVFAAGGALGMLFGVMLGNVIEIGGFFTPYQISTLMRTSFPPYPHTGIQFLCMALGGLVMGGASISFQKFMIIASSAFVGAAAVISGLSGTLLAMTSHISGRGVLILIGWVMLGVIGLVVQFHLTSDLK